MFLSSQEKYKKFATEHDSFSTFASGFNHVVFLNKSGDIFSFGNNRHNQLGRRTLLNEDSESKLIKLPYSDKTVEKYEIRDIQCRANLSVVLTKCGKVFSNYFRNFNSKEYCDRTQETFVQVDFPIKSSKIIQIATGSSHLLALTSTGQVYALGDNTHCQLGLCHSKPVFPPAHIQSLAGIGISKVSCGANHSVVLSNTGQVYTFGSNAHGQLGLKSFTGKPEAIFKYGIKNFIDASCGDDHTALLSSDGKLYTFGLGTSGQLGQLKLEGELYPRAVMELVGDNVKQVCCGPNHTLVVTDTNKLIGFGSNIYGELGEKISESLVSSPTKICQFQEDVNLFAGLDFSYISQCANGDLNDTKPLCVRLNDLKTRFYDITCGDFRIEETDDWLILVNEYQEFICAVFSNIECINSSFIDDDRTFTENQISKINVSITDIISFCSFSDRIDAEISAYNLSTKSKIPSFSNTKSIIKKSFKTSVDKFLSSIIALEDLFEPKNEQFNAGLIISLMLEWLGDDDEIFGDLIRFFNAADKFVWEYLGEWFRDSVFGGRQDFIEERIYQQTMLLQPLTDSEITRSFSLLVNHTREMIESIYHSKQSEKLVPLLKFFGNLWEVNNIGWVCTSKETNFIKPGIKIALKKIPCEDEGRKFLLPTSQTIIPHTFFQSDVISENVDLLKAYSHIVPASESLVSSSFFTSDPEGEGSAAGITTMVFDEEAIDGSRNLAGENEGRDDSGDEGDVIFQIQYGQTLESAGDTILRDAINALQRNIMESFRRNGGINTAGANFSISMSISTGTLQPGQTVEQVAQDAFRRATGRGTAEKPFDKFDAHFFRYPFLFNLNAKCKFLKIYSAKKISQERGLSFMRTMRDSNNEEGINFNVKIRRSHLFDDALEFFGKDLYSPEKCSDNADLLQAWKKPLRVTFVGEVGLDQGGLSKEFITLFFQEVVKRNLFNVVSEGTQEMIWFNVGYRDKDEEKVYRVIGRVLALAIYNSCMCSLQFPTLVYKSILSWPVCYDDLAEFRPQILKSLNALLLHEDGEDDDEIFGLNFTTVVEEVERFDEKGSEKVSNKKVVELKFDGENISVTKRNRKEYCKLFCYWLLNTGVSKKLSVFRQGFLESSSENTILQMFLPLDLKTLIQGSPVYDFDKLESVTQYKEPYSADHPQIISFWRVFHKLDDKYKRLFLKFTTGTTRAPIQGLSGLNFYIQLDSGSHGSLDNASLPFTSITPSASSQAAPSSVHNEILQSNGEPTIKRKREDEVEEKSQKTFDNKDSTLIYKPSYRLPSAHTCANVLDLPIYPNDEVLKNCLLYALENASDGFHLI